MRIIIQLLRALIYTVIILGCTTTPVYAEKLYVFDNANVLQKETISTIESQARILEETNNVVVKIETASDLGIETLESRAQRSFSTIDKTSDQVGILIFLSTDKQKYKMMATPNLEYVLNVENFTEVRDQVLVPNLLNGDYDYAIRDTYIQLQQQINPELSTQSKQVKQKHYKGFLLGTVTGASLVLITYRIYRRRKRHCS